MSPKAERDWRLYADDIIEACGKVRRFVAGMSYDTFAADERTRDAVIRNLEIIGEAAGELPREVTARAPQIPWRLICDMRNVLAHAYFGVSLKIVWDTATTQIEELRKQGKWKTHEDVERERRDAEDAERRRGQGMLGKLRELIGGNG